MQITKETKKYRPELDGLRAIAVLSVIIYHLDITIFNYALFRGGYNGVDIFFVISGYLIASNLLKELKETNTIDIGGFYEKRCRRILPVLLLTLILTIPLAWERLLPSLLIDYSNSAVSSIFLFSNIYFYLNQIKYGAIAALDTPLLHTWSLSLEEQFYLIFPLFCVIIYRIRKQILPVSFFMIFLYSLYSAHYMYQENKYLVFYTFQSRLWEILAGVILAYTNSKKIEFGNVKIKRTTALLGFLLTIFSLLVPFSDGPLSAYRMIPPVIGTIAIISCVQNDQFIYRILANKSAVGIGLVSYSSYMIHYPLIAFFNLEHSRGLLIKLSFLAIILIISYCSYHAIEKPFRNRTVINSRKFFVIIGMMLFLILGFHYLVLNTGGLWGRYNKIQTELITSFDQTEYISVNDPTGRMGYQPHMGRYHINCNMRATREACRIGDEKIVFLGDSFAGAVKRAFMDGFAPFGMGWIDFTYDGCPFVTPNMWFANVPDCVITNEDRREVINNFRDRKIFVIAVDERQFLSPKRRLDAPLEAGLRNQTEGEKLKPVAAWDAYFKNIKWILSQGHKVILIKTLPLPKVDGRIWISSNRHYISTQNFPDIYNETTPRDLILKDMAIYPEFDPDQVIEVEPSEVLCNMSSNKCYDVKRDYGPLYNGERHPSYLAAKLLADFAIQEALAKGWIQNENFSIKRAIN